MKNTWTEMLLALIVAALGLQTAAICYRLDRVIELLEKLAEATG